MNALKAVFCIVAGIVVFSLIKPGYSYSQFEDLKLPTPRGQVSVQSQMVTPVVQLEASPTNSLAVKVDRILSIVHAHISRAVSLNGKLRGYLDRVDSENSDLLLAPSFEKLRIQEVQLLAEQEKTKILAQRFVASSDAILYYPIFRKQVATVSAMLKSLFTQQDKLAADLVQEVIENSSTDSQEGE